ncbi:hypothetical protein SNEBB_009282 [Seison nebaliae]|nr:hypothetical protein SNEBB_009282 [Seison nebaliae]
MKFSIYILTVFLLVVLLVGKSEEKSANYLSERDDIDNGNPDSFLHDGNRRKRFLFGSAREEADELREELNEDKVEFNEERVGKK